MLDVRDPKHYSSWIEVSASALLKNLAVFKKISRETFQIGAVLKGNAYGHGLYPVFSVIRTQVDAIYVIAAQDAFLVREWETKHEWAPQRIIVIGAITLTEAQRCSRENIEVVIGGLEWRDYWKVLAKQNLSLKVHLHLDTGLSREGFRNESLLEDLGFLKEAKNTLKVVAWMSHFSNTEDVTEQTYALSQLSAFKKMGQRLQKFLRLKGPIEEHLSASAGALVLPKAQLSTARIGISLYGLWPSSEARISSQFILKNLPTLVPALTWKCKSQVIKWIKKGSYVGYGCTYRCTQDTRIAVFPVGYFDGYPRMLSGKAHVLIQQKRCPVIGRVMMNHLIVDVTQIRSKASRLEAVLLGSDKKETLPAESLAAWAETIHYELVTRIGPHLQRIVVE
jgi:alanine racemase